MRSPVEQQYFGFRQANIYSFSEAKSSSDRDCALAADVPTFSLWDHAAQRSPVPRCIPCDLHHVAFRRGWQMWKAVIMSLTFACLQIWGCCSKAREDGQRRFGVKNNLSAMPTNLEELDGLADHHTVCV